MSIIRVGSNKRYSEGWDAIFGKKKAAKKAAPVAKKRPKKKKTVRKK